FGDDSCLDGQTLCIDGSCSADCGNIPARKNPCGCLFQYPPEQAKDLVPCAAFGDVTIEHYNKDDTSQTIDFCTEKFNVSGSMPLWGDWDGSQEQADNSSIDGRRFWSGNQCPTAPKYHYTYTEPLWIGVFSCVGAEAFVLMLWIVYKFLREMPVRRLRRRDAGFTTTAPANVHGASTGDDSEKTSLSKDMPDEKKGKASSSASDSDAGNETSDIYIKGYSNDALGWVGFSSVILTSLGWIVWLGFWIGDYYGTLGEPDSLSHYDSGLLDETFIPIWIFAVTWTVTCCVFLKRIRNFFRIECLPSEGQYVQIERELKELKMATSASKIVALAKLVEEKFVKFIKADVHVATCKIKLIPGSKLRYFNYMCTRYVFNEKTKQYGPYLFDMGSTHRQIHTHSSGLSNQEASARLSLIGPNFISVYVPSYPLAFVLELSNFFYLYQLMIQTGTLTKEGLEFYGGMCAQTTSSSTPVAAGDSQIGTVEFAPFIESYEKLPDKMRMAAATCHAVAEVEDGHVHVFVKGSFEKVKEHLDSATVPNNYLAAANHMARRGGYVLAMGHRDLGDIDVSDMQNWTRDDMENGCELVGFIVFKNMLKEDTPEAIAKLKNGSTRTVMITGDTALTGVFIAKSAGLMSEQATVYLGDLDKSGELYWVDVDKEEPVSQEQIDRVISSVPGDDYELAMTGKAFNRLDAMGLIRQYVLHTRVFARFIIL
ncbi:hypothetical protein EV177_007733, partial [Coemansia sp. RSA 1804]